MRNLLAYIAFLFAAFVLALIINQTYLVDIEMVRKVSTAEGFLQGTIGFIIFLVLRGAT